MKNWQKVLLLLSLVAGMQKLSAENPNRVRFQDGVFGIGAGWQQRPHGILPHMFMGGNVKPGNAWGPMINMNLGFGRDNSILRTFAGWEFGQSSASGQRQLYTPTFEHINMSGWSYAFTLGQRANIGKWVMGVSGTIGGFTHSYSVWQSAIGASPFYFENNVPVSGMLYGMTMFGERQITELPSGTGRVNARIATGVTGTSVNNVNGANPFVKAGLVLNININEQR